MTERLRQGAANARQAKSRYAELMRNKNVTTLSTGLALLELHEQVALVCELTDAAHDAIRGETRDTVAQFRATFAGVMARALARLEHRVLEHLDRIERRLADVETVVGARKLSRAERKRAGVALWWVRTTVAQARREGAP